MNWGIHNCCKQHRVKARKNLTLMLFYDPTKGGITFRIPKWIRFPLFGLSIAIVLGVLYTMTYIADLECQLAYERSESQSVEYAVVKKETVIDSLEKTETKRLVQLKTLGALALKLEDELNDLQAYKEVIDTKLSSTEKTTDEQPDSLTISRNSAEVSSAPSSLAKEAEGDRDPVFKRTSPATLNDLSDSSLDFSVEVDRLLDEMATALVEIDEEEATLEVIEEQVDEILPFWDAYPSVIPVADTYVTSPYGMRRNPLGSGYEFHSGVDFKAYYQDVWATASGTVTFAGYTNGYGNLVVIDHGYGLMTKYAHNSKILVEEGDVVERYDLISKSGNSGRSSGPHLHYEVLLDGETQNPLDYIYEGDK